MTFLEECLMLDQISLVPKNAYSKTCRTLPELSPAIIGRDNEEADLTPTMHPCLSRKHCVLSFIDGGWHITDLGSKNGTKVNFRDVGDTPVKLTRGDIVRLGHDMLTYTVVFGPLGDE